MKARTLFIRVVFGLAGAYASARVYVSLPDAVARMFPDASLEAEAVYLTGEQAAEAAKKAGTDLTGPVLYTHRVMRDGREIARVYLDRHKVRTLPETLAIVLSPEGMVLGVEVLVFAEPETYKPRPVWLDLFKENSVETPPEYKRNIDGITGATLTGRAVTDAVRRALAVEAVRKDSTP